jgi:hypothetical protein
MKKKRRHSHRGLGLGASAPGRPDPRKGAHGFRNYENINDMPARLLRHFARDAIEAESAACRMTMTELTGSTRQQGPINKSVIAVFNALMEFVDWRTVPRQMVCNPSYEMLAAYANVGISTARAAVGVLEDFGWVRKRNVLEPNPVLRNNLKKIYTSNEYRITIPARWHAHFTKGAKIGVSTLQRYLSHRIEALVAQRYPQFVDNFYTCLNRICTNQRVRQLVGTIFNDIPGPSVAPKQPKWFLDLQPGLAKLKERFSDLSADPRPPEQRMWAAHQWLDPLVVPDDVTQAGDRFTKTWRREAGLYALVPPARWDEGMQQALWEVLEAARAISRLGQGVGK